MGDGALEEWHVSKRRLTGDPGLIGEVDDPFTVEDFSRVASGLHRADSDVAVILVHLSAVVSPSQEWRPEACQARALVRSYDSGEGLQLDWAEVDVVPGHSEEVLNGAGENP